MSFYEPEAQEILLRIFGDVQTYQRSLPSITWVKTGNKNDRGEPMWAGERSVILADLAKARAVQ